MNRRCSNRGGDTGRPTSDESAPRHLLTFEGMRAVKAFGLRWRDVNFERGTAHIVQTIAPDKSEQRRGVDSRPNQDRVRSVRLTAARERLTP